MASGSSGSTVTDPARCRSYRAVVSAYVNDVASAPSPPTSDTTPLLRSSWTAFDPTNT